MMQTALNQGELMRVVMGLLFVLLLILVLSWLVKRLHGMQMSSTKGFQSVASMILGPKEKITLLKVGARYLLVGSGSGHVTLLYDFGEQLPTGFDSMNKTSFAALLKSVTKS
ncbi:flagellar biosynthetic protein FliO [Fluoribacter gormanii]|uniref:Flagellar protein n=2 Tax=Fluoribacter gormanii TaxID=464 RepID=A0A377GI06_9GAMM|nr:flagellar biosynthetic protein FliO [Fluoribacter gormanii]KTD03410.1 flagellar protein fliO [Fluoribacter gormanii]MCW8444003.1 flagellar biosynthetic protein FliO [Fluoribacter gormanii]MCW8469185.1 flagellar biosynthetic protein FliO [Fluoribacter gormanii]SIQ50095.1 flagellar protein FliO/FliZ [Fluoribacter gormanii]STO24437.1 Flagellar protein fliO [Fluoribacter gormanii]